MIKVEHVSAKNHTEFFIHHIHHIYKDLRNFSQAACCVCMGSIVQLTISHGDTLIWSRVVCNCAHFLNLAVQAPDVCRKLETGVGRLGSLGDCQLHPHPSPRR